eukprot:3976716-Ditylum_brightwellii.AAC.1
MEWNLFDAATSRVYRKGFTSNELDLDKDAEQGDFIQKVDPYLGMVVTKWKYSRVLEIIITVMEKGATTFCIKWARKYRL